jgi:hypothetical protein
MADIAWKIEAYVGRRVDFNSECELVQQHDGSVAITKWAVVGKDKPTPEQLDALAAEADALLAQGQFVTARKNAYPSIGEQLDMIYWDAKNGTTTWADAIAAVKAAHPKPE